MIPPFPPIGELMRRFDIRPSRRFSQNFLRHYGRCEAIADAAGIGTGHVVVEIGAGLGNLTTALALRAGHVIAFEPDRAFAEWHAELAARHANLTLVADWFSADRLEAELAPHVARGLVPAVVANLPYKETSSILLDLVNGPRAFHPLAVMVQREVAERIAAGPGRRECGLLSCHIALRYTARIAMRLAPGEFTPPPDVHSAVLRLDPLPAPLWRDDAHRDALFALMKGLFTYRRKTLANGLCESIAHLPREEAPRVLARAGIEPSRRVETLSIGEFLALEGALPGGAP